MEFLIALLLIRRTNSFRNSYELSKVMAWKFGLIEFNKIMTELINNFLVSTVIKELLINSVIILLNSINPNFKP